MPAHLEQMIANLGTIESPIGSNRGKKIDEWNSFFGLKAVPWCATSASVFSRTGVTVKPQVWSPMALDFARNDRKITIKAVQLGYYKPKAGDYLVWNYGGGRGHIDYIIHYNSSDNDTTINIGDTEFVIEPQNFLVIGANRKDAIRIAVLRMNKIRASGAKWIVDVQGSSLRGKASYYAHKFHGRTTASGDRFNMYDLTAAHKTLPFGSIVRVENVSNGKEVTVKINDRGPFTDNRIIDLSYAAADSIDMIESGIANVKIEVLNGYH